jgi:hypothetical protein
MARIEKNIEILMLEFFKAFQSFSEATVFTEHTPIEMMKSEVDKDGWFEWKLIKGTLTVDEYRKIEKNFGVILPDNFIEWHRKYFFLDGDSSLVRFPRSNPNLPLKEIRENLDWEVAECLIAHGLVPFADNGDDIGPLVFDTRNQVSRQDFPIRLFDHDYGCDMKGLSEIIFSSFAKLLECTTFFITENDMKAYERFAEFLKIDPDGAGATGRKYWQDNIDAAIEDDY